MKLSQSLAANLLFIFSFTTALATDFNLPSNQWRLVSLPANPPKAENTVEHIFADDIPGNYGPDWLLFEYDAGINQYKALTESTPVFQGKGYWIIQVTGKMVTLDMPDDSSFSASSIDLASSQGHGIQWNLVGYPFSDSHRLDHFTVNVVNSDICGDSGCSFDEALGKRLLHNQVWIYNGQEYEEKNPKDVLYPWEAFWVAALSGSQDYTISLISKTDPTEKIPYSQPRFRNTLNQSWLQWQSSLDGGYNIDKDLRSISSDYFYLSTDGHMTLETESDGNKRVELRQKKEWNIWMDSGIEATLKCHQPDALKEYTWMQLFDKDKNKPLARLIWRKYRAGMSNHLWLFLRTDNGEEKIDLGSNPDSFFTIEMAVNDANLTIKLNGSIRMNRHVAYWKSSKNYFKTGVYLSGSINNNVPEGSRKAKVQFADLRYY
jgi:hypothetical protein